MDMSHRCQLITYPDSLGGSLRTLRELLAHELRDAVAGGVHILPPFPSTADRGFAPVRYDRIDDRLGSWLDIEAISESTPVTLDVMVNHLSRYSPEFTDVVRHGRSSPWFDAFIPPSKVFPDGPTAAQLAAIHLRKPSHPFSDVTLADGRVERFWTTFSFGADVDSADQVDLDATSDQTAALYRRWFRELAQHGIACVRLDAVGYITKRAGTSCFMVEPEFWQYLAMLTRMAADVGMTVLPEVHAGAVAHRELCSEGYRSYDFQLPGIVLDAFHTGDAAVLRTHLAHAPRDQVTMLDCHDGVPVHPDLDGIVPDARLAQVAASCIERGANVSLEHHSDGTTSRVHQINCTFRDALGSDDRLVAARAVQLFAPGQPQVYYVGLLGGCNQPVEPGGDGRDINRPNYSLEQVRSAFERVTTKRQLTLMQLRNTHTAFGGTMELTRTSGPTELGIVWANGNQWCRLDVDLATAATVVTATNEAGLVETTEIVAA